MRKKRDHLIRYIILGTVFIAVCFIYGIRLVSIQIAGQDYYTVTETSSNKKRTEAIKAKRGEIYDTNGKPLVSNEYIYFVELDYGSLSGYESDKNEIILRLIECADNFEDDISYTVPEIPFIINEADQTAVYEYNTEYMESTKGKRILKLLTQLGLEENDGADKAAQLLFKRYGLIEYDTKTKSQKALYSPDDFKTLLAYRTDMDASNFSPKEPYRILYEVPEKFVISITEGRTKGFNIITEANRVYNYPGYASHILGRVGKIQEQYVDYYTSLGYPLNATVGLSGAEQAFEKYLRGIDGELTIIEDSKGNIIDQYVSKEPVPGGNVYLTLDIDMQIRAEDTLADNIEFIKDKAQKSGRELTGEDADCGAVVAMDPNNYSVLAIASYPTYDLSVFSENYASLSTDPLSPLFNRALEGAYTPGSTFKISVAAGALNENIITPHTHIECAGVYGYYASTGFAPRCWINKMYGGRHGELDISNAIKVSCNCFFYETGRLMGIDNINKYAKNFGLGQSTGIELSESTGILSGPAYRAENGLDSWNPGDTVQTAIGQMDNKFTPLQLSVYISTVLNNGTRKAAHILKEVKSFKTGETIYSYEESVLSSIKLNDGVQSLLLDAMKDVTSEEEGSASRLFANYPVSVGGKTGTAEGAETRSDNAVFTAFAPFDSPKIVASSVIEHGSTGSDAGYVVRDMFNYILNIDYKDNFDAFRDEFHSRPPEDDNIDSGDNGNENTD